MSAAVSVPVVDKEDKNDTSRHDVQHLEEDYIAKQGPKALEGDGFEANIDEQALKQVKSVHHPRLNCFQPRLD